MENRRCQSCDQTFDLEPQDLAFYEKMSVCVPRDCPSCRMIQKLLYRNERTLYRRSCDLCKQGMLSMYHPKYASPVYCIACYHSDKWDPKSYAKDYLPDVPVFKQFEELMNIVPKVTLHTGTQVPSPGTDYQNFSGANKDCYLVFNATKNEDCAYIRGLIDSKNCCDCYFGDQQQYCYGNVNTAKSSRVSWSEGVSDSLDCYLCRDCISVQNCFGCVNLRHAKYQFFNEQLSKEDWESKVREITKSHTKFKEALNKFKTFEKTLPRKASAMLKTHDSTGNYIYESSNCRDSFEVFNSENCRYGLFIKYAKDSQDLVGRGLQAELLYNTVAVGSQCSRIIATWNAEISHDLEYCFDMRSTNNCMFSTGMKHVSYCLLNKQYSEEDYLILRDKIITGLRLSGVYGDFLPAHLSPWAYNETIAAEIYPKSKEEILSSGYRFEDDIPRTSGKETIRPDELPDSIDDVSDAFLDHVFKCEDCGYNYRIIRNELNLLRSLGLPLPRRCISCRYEERISRRGSFSLIERKCSSCDKNLNTVYTEERAPILYCEECYQQKII